MLKPTALISLVKPAAPQHISRAPTSSSISAALLLLVVSLQPPDLETRIAILMNKAEHDQLEIPYEVMEFMASNRQTNKDTSTDQIAD